MSCRSYSPLYDSLGWSEIETPSPAGTDSVESPSIIAKISGRSTEPSELVSRAPNTALSIAAGACWPVIDSRAAANSFSERLPLPSKSYFENKASALMPFLRRTSCRFLIATASIVPRAPSIMVREKGEQQ